MDYLMAKELIEVFETEGNFYDLNVSGRSHLCRRALRLSRKGTAAEKVDAVFIISSPGNCKPIDINIGDVEGGGYLQMKPKSVEHQLMRLMEKLRWDLTYVINLSDLCGRRADDFRSSLHYMGRHFVDQHSIFSPDRSTELNGILAPETKVIACWGANALLNEDASRALKALVGKGKVRGMKHETWPYYYQPSPFLKRKGLEWLEEMVEQMSDVLVR